MTVLLITILGLALAWLARDGVEVTVRAEELADVEASLPDDVWAAFDAAVGTPPGTD